MKNLIKICLFILFVGVGYLLNAQSERTITGRVYSTIDGMTLPGASVFVPSKTISSEASEGIVQSFSVGVITDLEGDFSLKIPKGSSQIHVSFMGHKTKIINLTDKKNYVVYLEVEATDLEEVIVTGYQEIEKRKLTSAYNKVKVDEVSKSGVASIDKMLAGEIAGVAIQTTNGSPNAPVKVQIRGVSTLNANFEPLWVLDGVPLEGDAIPKDLKDKDNIDELMSFPIAGINPQDIEDITVLKDASATSIYGARAANGVIVITTKKGKKGAMRINFNASTFVTQKPDFSKLNLMNSNEKVDFELSLAKREDLRKNKERGNVAKILIANKEYEKYQKSGFKSISKKSQDAINNLRKNSTNWGDAIYQNAINQQYGLSISGGGDKNDYYFSLGYYKEKGSVIGTSFKRFNATLKNNYAITDKLDIGFSIFSNRNISESFVSGFDAYTRPSNYSRNVNPYIQLSNNGEIVYDSIYERNNDQLLFNIDEERRNTHYNVYSNSIKPMFNASYRFSEDLKLNSQLGFQFDFNQSEKMGEKESYFTRKYRFRTRYTDNKGNDAYFLPDGGVILNWEDNFFQYNWKSTLQYSHLFGENHEIDVMLGNEIRENRKKQIHTKAFGYNSNTLTTVPITDERLLGRASLNPYLKLNQENAFVSFFSTASYTYKRKYTIFGNVRFDGSNLFGVNPKYRYLPLWSVAAAWNISEESFFNIKFINRFKLRASYGVQGNIDKSTSPFPVGEFKTESILPGVSENIIRVANAPNANLRWEKTTSYNIGFDLGILDRISITGDYYDRKGSDLVGFRATPQELGFLSINTNWASMTNRGFELGINTTNIKTKDFTWSTNLNFVKNINVVDRVQETNEAIKPTIVQGYGVNAVFALKTIGFDKNGLPLFLKNGKEMTAVDFFRLNKAVDGSQFTRKERRDLYTYIGSTAPKITGGFINSFNYKQFSLRVSTNFNLAQMVKQAPAYHMTQIEPGRNYTRQVLSAGKGNNPALIGLTTPGFDTKKVFGWFNSDETIYRDLSIWYKEVSYIRINSIRLGYAVPSKSFEKTKISSLSFFVEGRNLFVFGTNYDGYFDPETFGNIYAQPISKNISLGFNISFQ